MKRNKTGFTIVELLIVIVVIGILAAITIVAFNGVQSKAREASVKAAVTQVAQKLATYAVDHADTYPPDLATAGVTSTSSTTTYQYSTTGPYYCIVATTGTLSYFQTSTQSAPTRGTCYGLVGWWNLDGNANDASGNNRNGTVTGATLTTGQNGTANAAYNFSDTVVQWIDTGYNFPLEQFTVSLWVRPTGNSVNTYATLISNARDCCAVYNGFQIDYARASSSNLNMRLWAGGSAVAANVSYSAATLNAWQLITMTYDHTTARFYKNGAQVGSSVYTGTIGSSIYDVFIGRGGWTAGYSFGGDIDDVRIYDHALSADDITDMFAAGAQ